jgi:CubicO group peptidase (beta-lactamase class C family)
MNLRRISLLFSPRCADIVQRSADEGQAMAMTSEAIGQLADESGFSGVVRINRGDELVFAEAYGLADRRLGIPNEIDTHFGLASGTKGLTALTVVSLIEDGTFESSTTARSLLGDDLPLIRDDVTIEHLLAHRSGIGDYYDEDVHTDVDAFVLPVPVGDLATTEAYLAVLDGFPTKFAPDERFAYCNSGYVVLALLAERASGVPFHELVVQRVCEPAGMRDTGFFRSDELPARTALGYVDATRTNVLQLPVRGSGDGGIYSTVADVSSLWRAFFAGEIVSSEWVSEMVRPRSKAEKRRYGLGFWLDASTEAVLLVGMDAGVSFWSLHDPRTDLTATVVSNTSDGAWPIARRLREQLGG